jgi:hypothetical protein
MQASSYTGVSIFQEKTMFACPVCKSKSISGLDQLALRSATTCGRCGAVVTVKFKPTNFLVVAFLVLSGGWNLLFADMRIDVMNLQGLSLLCLLGLLQIANVEYVRT